MSNKSKDVIISKKKPSYKVSNYLEDYLKNYNRIQEIPIEYNDLKRYVGSVKVIDNDDNDTLWQRVFFNDSERFEIEKILIIKFKIIIHKFIFKKFYYQTKKIKFDSCNEIWSIFRRKKDKIKNFD